MTNLCTCNPLLRFNFVCNYYDGVQVHHFPSLFLHIVHSMDICGLCVYQVHSWTSSDYVYFCSALLRLKVVCDDGLVYFESIGQV